MSRTNLSDAVRQPAINALKYTSNRAVSCRCSDRSSSGPKPFRERSQLPLLLWPLDVESPASGSARSPCQGASKVTAIKPFRAHCSRRFAMNSLAYSWSGIDPTTLGSSIAASATGFDALHLPVACISKAAGNFPASRPTNYGPTHAADQIIGVTCAFLSLCTCSLEWIGTFLLDPCRPPLTSHCLPFRSRCVLHSLLL